MAHQYTVSKRQYEAARKRIEKAQSDAVRAMNKGDQEALDKATDEAVKAIAIIDQYKSERAEDHLW